MRRSELSVVISWLISQYLWEAGGNGREELQKGPHPSPSVQRFVNMFMKENTDRKLIPKSSEQVQFFFVIPLLLTLRELCWLQNTYYNMRFFAIQLKTPISRICNIACNRTFDYSSLHGKNLTGCWLNILNKTMHLFLLPKSN